MWFQPKALCVAQKSGRALQLTKQLMLRGDGVTTEDIRAKEITAILTAAINCVIAFMANQIVGAFSAQQNITAAATDHRVIAGAAIKRITHSLRDRLWGPPLGRVNAPCRARVRKRALVDERREDWSVSIRRACRVLLFDPKVYRYKSRRPDQANLERRIKEICETRVRYGYRWSSQMMKSSTGYVFLLKIPGSGSRHG